MNEDREVQGPELLNIKEAASLLNVSEISLRRWTDSGKLSCFRVGGKRERRFRRQDLLDFLENQSTAHKQQAMEPALHTSGTLLEGIPIEYGKHICSLYETDRGRIKLAVPFLMDGLRRGDMCFLIAADEEKMHILDHLQAVFGDSGKVTKTNQLIISDGMDSGDDMLEFLEHNFVKATQSGNRQLRVLGDMTWFLTKGLGQNELFDYENRYDKTLGHQFPVISLCQYDARKFSGMAIVNALKSHEDTFQYPLTRFIGC